MRAINHALTGAVIGLAVSQPLVALPVAFISHFICDAIPHFSMDAKEDLLSDWFKVFILFDAILCAGLVGVLALYQPRHWVMAALGAFLAASPDLFQVKRYIRTLKSGKVAEHQDWFGKFHSWVQWFQRPSGAIVEAAWFVAAVAILVTRL